MTFTIIARDPETKALGVCLATGVLGVAARCPLVKGGVAAISSQCFTDWRIAYRGMEMAEQGTDPKKIMAALREGDGTFDDYRQVGIVDIHGRTAVASPIKGKAFTGHLEGDGFIAMGNGLSGKQVIEDMFEAYQQETDCAFEERLLRTLEAGFKAGGEPKGQMSGGLIVSMPGVKRPRTELRIDMAKPTTEEGGDAVLDLRRSFDAYGPLVPYYDTYWPENPAVGWREFLAAS